MCDYSKYVNDMVNKLCTINIQGENAVAEMLQFLYCA